MKTTKITISNICCLIGGVIINVVKDIFDQNANNK
jgi:hypothetical protein